MVKSDLIAFAKFLPEYLGECKNKVSSPKMKTWNFINQGNYNGTNHAVYVSWNLDIIILKSGTIYKFR